MNIFKSAKLSILAILMFTLSSFELAGPDLVVKIVRDDLSTSKKCTLGIFKNGSFKSVDDKYKILSFDFYVLNHRGETKYYAPLEKSDVDLTTHEKVEILKGDLIVIENVKLIHIKSGDVLKVNRITERYLVR